MTTPANARAMTQASDGSALLTRRWLFLLAFVALACVLNPMRAMSATSPATPADATIWLAAAADPDPEPEDPDDDDPDDDDDDD